MNVGRASKFAGISIAVLSLAAATAAAQQWTPQKRGSDNMEVVAHLPLGPRLSVADIDIEQELDRPYAYVGRIKLFDGARGTDIIDLSDPYQPEVIYRWRIENDDLHQGLGGMDVKHFKWNECYDVVQS